MAHTTLFMLFYLAVGVACAVHFSHGYMRDNKTEDQEDAMVGIAYLFTIFLWPVYMAVIVLHRLIKL